jgi:hypothetical protein
LLIVVGAFLIALGAVLMLGAITNMSHHPYQLNSPFLWVFLFAGLVLAGFGVVISALSLQ